MRFPGLPFHWTTGDPHVSALRRNANFRSYLWRSSSSGALYKTTTVETTTITAKPSTAMTATASTTKASATTNTTKKNRRRNEWEELGSTTYL